MLTFHRASAAIYGTPTPIAQSVSEEIHDRFRDAVSQAELHYSQAKSIVSKQISGEPKPVHEQMFSSVESAYSGSITAASQRLQKGLAAASSAVYGTMSPQESL